MPAGALPVSAKVGTNDRVFAGQQRRDAAPHQMSLWETVQQQDRWPEPCDRTKMLVSPVWIAAEAKPSIVPAPGYPSRIISKLP
jgi:hypothetical protein